MNRSKLADKYLTGLKGVEIGGAAHNAFGLDTINVDKTDSLHTVFKKYEIEHVGHAMPVDVVANGDSLPFSDNSYDFVISSHVIEHFYNPIKALQEWARIATQYIFIIFPNRDNPFDANKPITPLKELIERNHQANPPTHDDHWTVWTLDSFLELTGYLGMNVVETQFPDDKVGNGTTIVIKL